MSIDNTFSTDTTARTLQQYPQGQQHRCRNLWPARQLRGMFREQIFEAVETISQPVLGAEDIHQTRKCIKRARATLRLLRSAIGESDFVREDSTLKDAADALDALRDSEVVLKTIDGLIKRCKSHRAKAGLQSYRLRLQQVHRASLASQDTRATQTAVLLETAAMRARDWTIADTSYSISESVEQCYQRARRAYRRAADSADENDLHALRKRTRYLSNALEDIAFQPLPSMHRLLCKLSKLDDLLGEDHDLGMLLTALKAHRRGFARAQLQAVMTMVEYRRARLQGRAMKRAAHLYQDKPSRFVTDLESHWRCRKNRLAH